MVSEHPSISRFREDHARLGGRGDVVILPDSVHTAALAAEALGCEVGAIANSLVFDAGGQPVLVLTSGAHRVDTAKVAGLLGVQRVRRATPDFVRAATGQAIGGVAPIGHPAPLPTLVDRALAQYDVLWAAAGHSHAVFRLTFDDLVRITGGMIVDVDEPDRRERRTGPDPKARPRSQAVDQ